MKEPIIRECYALFLDDVRNPPYYNPHRLPWVVARSYQEAVDIVLKRGVPNHFSLDHDLGSDKNGKPLPTGFDFVKWLVDQSLDKKLNISDSRFDCHSANPVGKENILSFIAAYKGFI